jgi:phage baseplate assembly protein V
MKQRNAVYAAAVSDANDPQGLGRVRVKLPDFDEEPWARLATFSAGPERGSWFVPDTGDEVLVAFEQGDARRPFVLGSLWSSSNRPPESNPERNVLRTGNGATIAFDVGASKIEVEDANGNSITLEPAGITITSSGKVTVNASQVEVSAGAVAVNAGMSHFAGVVQCDTLIANSVVAQSYTPGAGNVL